MKIDKISPRMLQQQAFDTLFNLYQIFPGAYRSCLTAEKLQFHYMAQSHESSDPGQLKLAGLDRYRRALTTVKNEGTNWLLDYQPQDMLRHTYPTELETF